MAIFATQTLWNWLTPNFFHLYTISLAQTLGLLLLSPILFGGFQGGRPSGWTRKRREWQQRMANRIETLSPEAREKFRQQMQTRCGMGWRRRPEATDASAQQPI